MVSVRPPEKAQYEKPIVQKMKRMTFPVDIIQANGQRLVCKQCSSCHACR